MSEPSEFPPYPPPEPALPAVRPPRPAAVGHRVGRVTGVQTRVEARGNDRSSVTVLTSRVSNLTTGSQVQAASGMLPKPLRTIFLVLFVVFFLLVLGLILDGFVTMSS